MTTTGDIVWRYLTVFVYVFICFGAAFIVGQFSQKWPRMQRPMFRAILLIVGASLLLVAGVGKLGWEIQTIDGTSKPEMLNNSIFNMLSYAGTFCIFFDLALNLPRVTLQALLLFLSNICGTIRRRRS